MTFIVRFLSVYNIIVLGTYQKDIYSFLGSPQDYIIVKGKNNTMT